MPALFAKIVSFLREVFTEWSNDNALSLGAALSYYTIFSMAPLLVLAIAIAGLVFGRSAAEGEIVTQLEGMIGASGAELISGMVARASEPRSGWIATVIGLVTMLFGASGVFGQLQSSLNQIWGTESSRRTGVKGHLQRRAASFGMILVIGLLLFASMLLSAVISGVHELIARYVPQISTALPAANFALSFVMTTVLFAMIYKFLPDARIQWRDVWLGAAVTALLFTIGKGLIGVYLGRAGITSVYGAAGSLALVLLWVYYSAQLLFLGAEFTEVYSRRYGSRLGETK